MATDSEQPKPLLHAMWTRYSSWTSRITLLLEYFQIPHDTTWSNPYHPHDPRPAVLEGCTYPTLQPDPLGNPSFIVDDSLAIAEYLAETAAALSPPLHLWPRDPVLRARARTAAAQMHSGFAALRNGYTTNFLARYEGPVPVSEAAAADLRKLAALWSRSRAQTRERLAELGEEDEGFLFGGFSIADAFFWPPLWRIRSYKLPLEGITEDGVAWMAKMWSEPAVKAEIKWYFEQAKDPRTVVAKDDDIFRGNPEIRYEQFDQSWEFDPSGYVTASVPAAPDAATA
ncbi:hypothetical protein BX600DRAFT_461059 [Xylariales sp. PMI_506]|nr:hypothetical protein BX600DRAFT_461059 [Xylariales sp. PMI_506]